MSFWAFSSIILFVHTKKGNLIKSFYAYDKNYKNGVFVASGDLDGDGIVNILDIIVEVNIILGAIDPTPQQEIAGDLNGDGSINILDVIALVNIIVGEE